jgi:Pyruvate/2-oxoacid:ferredoxin oxidoreductase gamma subunit
MCNWITQLTEGKNAACKDFVKENRALFETIDLETAARILEAVSKGQNYSSMRAAFYAAKLQEMPLEKVIKHLEDSASDLETLSKKAGEREAALIKTVEALINFALKFIK